MTIPLDDIPDNAYDNIGRPPFYTDPEEMQERIDEYFRLCDEGREIERYDKKRQIVHKYRERVPYTVPGLALYLGFTGKNVFNDYEKKPLFQGTIARARSIIENQRVEKALTGEHEARFTMFDLTNNFGYKAEQDIVINPVQRRTYTVIEEQSLRAQALADARLELERQQAIEHKTALEDAPGDTIEGELILGEGGKDE